MAGASFSWAQKKNNITFIMCSHEVCRPRYHCVALENIPAVHFNESCSLQDLLESVAGLRLCNATSKGFFFG